MCDFIPLCFTCGCDKKLKQEDNTPHVCPRCSNGAVFATKESNCFTFCFVPLVPLGSEHVWRCNICQWTASQKGPAPPVAMHGGHHGAPAQVGQGGYAPQGMTYPQQPIQPGYAPQPQQGYNPGYR